MFCRSASHVAQYYPLVERVEENRSFEWTDFILVQLKILKYVLKYRFFYVEQKQLDTELRKARLNLKWLFCDMLGDPRNYYFSFPARAQDFFW